MDLTELKRNIDTVMSRVNAAANRRAEITGKIPSVTVVAATKTQPPELINAAISLGVTSVGENRVQEFTRKRDGVQGADWHFIGTLQRNKVKYLVGSVALIQSVSSEETAREIHRIASERGVVQDVLAEVNIGEEQSKTGIAPQELDALVELIGGLSTLRLRGLMAVMPIGAGVELYDGLYGMYKRYEGGTFDILSAGMSGDFETAIEHGSNMVRIGTGFFGARNYIGV